MLTLRLTAPSGTVSIVELLASVWSVTEFNDWIEQGYYDTVEILSYIPSSF